MTDPDTRNESAGERRAWITAALQSAGFIAISDLAQQLGVSSMTVRRDLHALQAAGRVRLVYGGAVLAPAEPGSHPYPDDGNTAGRVRVAGCAAQFVGTTDTIAVDAGPTAYALAAALPDNFRGAVITHSIPVLHLLDELPAPPRTVALGGELLAERHAFVGPTTETALAQLRARTFFLSTAAVDAWGAYSRSPAEASVQRRLTEIADEVILLATHEVFESSAPARVAPLDRLTGVVTDRPLPHAVAVALRQAHVEVHVVEG